MSTYQVLYDALARLDTLRGRMRALHKILPPLSLLLLSLPTLGQNLELAGKLIAAIKETNDALTILDSVHTAATNALAGKPVTAGSDWYKLAVKFTVAAEDTKAVLLPSEIVVSEPVTASELANCSTRENAVGKLNSYLTGLKNARLSGQNSIQSLDDELKKVAAAKEGLAYLIRVHEQLIKVPVYGDLFVNSWIDLNTTVGESLGDLNSAYTDLKKRFAENVATLAQQISNLESNISLLTPCTPPGTWSGSGTDASVTINASIAPPPCYQTLSRKNLNVSITVEDGGAVSGGAVKYHESTTYGPPQNCDPSLLKIPFGYDSTWKLRSGSTSGGTITATFQVFVLGHFLEGSSAIFVGRVKDGHLNGELKFNGPSNTNTVHQIK